MAIINCVSHFRGTISRAQKNETPGKELNKTDNTAKTLIRIIKRIRRREEITRGSPRERRAQGTQSPDRATGISSTCCPLGIGIYIFIEAEGNSVHLRVRVVPLTSSSHQENWTLGEPCQRPRFMITMPRY